MNDRFKFRCFNTRENKYRNGMFIFDYMRGFGDKDCILEQCAGLKDKHGNLIYEGDIVEYENRYWEVFYSIPTMEWGLMGDDYSIYGNKIKRADTYTIDCEIIGNIHGDLLK